MGAIGAAWAWTLQWGGFNTVSLLNTFASGFVACIVVLLYCLLVYFLHFIHFLCFLLLCWSGGCGWKIPFERLCNVNPAWLNRKLKVTA